MTDDPEEGVPNGSNTAAPLAERLSGPSWAAEAGLSAGELPIGAVVVINGGIVAEAHTQERRQGRLLVHAELLALDAADRVLGARRRDATLYTTLEPCLGCLGATVVAASTSLGRRGAAWRAARAWP